VNTITATYAEFSTDLRFDVIVLAFGGLDLAWPEGEQQASISHSIRHLAPTGRLILHGPVHATDQPATRVSRIEPAPGITVLQIPTFDPSAGLVDSHDVVSEGGLMKDILRTRSLLSAHGGR
jgi:hypothetical protein